jgi:hypothetical protein
MADWLWRVPLCVGIGVGAGVLLAGALGARRAGIVGAVVVAAGLGVVVGLVLGNWDEALGGGLGGVSGAAASVPLVRGALRRGGTRGGTATLVGGAGLALAALALIPLVGYLEALALPALAARQRRRGGERYAGLRTLARD